mgnify:CR=1 FL=1
MKLNDRLADRSNVEPQPSIGDTARNNHPVAFVLQKKPPRILSSEEEPSHSFF